jgi:hypothetical protein
VGLYPAEATPDPIYTRRDSVCDIL